MAHSAQVSAQPWAQTASGLVNYRGRKTLSAVTGSGTAALAIAENLQRLCVYIFNGGTADAYLGPDDGVTTANGVLLKSGTVLTDVSSIDAWWVVTAGGAADIRVIEVE